MAKITAVLSSIWNGVTLVLAIAIWAGMAVGATVPLLWVIIGAVSVDQRLLWVTCVAVSGVLLAILATAHRCSSIWTMLTF